MLNAGSAQRASAFNIQHQTFNIPRHPLISTFVKVCGRSYFVDWTFVYLCHTENEEC